MISDSWLLRSTLLQGISYILHIDLCFTFREEAVVKILFHYEHIIQCVVTVYDGFEQYIPMVSWLFSVSYLFTFSAGRN
jgi:hypothetical protein